MVQITKYRKIYYIFSGILIGLSVFALAFWGLKFGIDFKGGSLLAGEFKTERISKEAIAESLNELQLGEIIMQPSGDRAVFLRFKEVDEETHQGILQKINEKAISQNPENGFNEKSFEAVGSSVSSELRSKAVKAIILVLAVIAIFIAFAFRKVSYPLASWKYGVAVLVALFHDVIIPLGVFAYLGNFYNIEISSAFIAAILMVLGYSVHDSIIVFDRVRENLTKRVGKDFDDTVNIAVNQTFARSINTSLTVLLVLLSIYIFGGESIKYFALALLIGVFAGTYSSIFIGSTLLVTMENRMKK